MSAQPTFLQKLTRRLGALILFPCLLPVFFVLHTERYYTGAVPLSDMLELGAAYVAGALLLYGLLRIFIRHKAAAGIVVFFLMILFLYWGEILQAIIRTFHFRQNYSNHPLYLLAFLALITAAALFIRRQKPATVQRLTFYLNVLLLIYVASELILLTAYALTGRLQHQLIDPQRAASEGAQQPHAGKDIYLLLFDEYASNPSLLNDWKTDNGGIAAWLTGKGFKMIPGSRSNYNQTQFSMASLLNMDYLQGYSKPRTIIGERDYQAIIPALEDPRVVRTLQQAGYAFTNYSIFDIAGQPQRAFEDLQISKRRLITNNTFYKILTKNYIPYLRYRREIKRNPAYYDPMYYRAHTYNTGIYRDVLRHAALPRRQPQFIYAHFLLPHPPYYYDSLGRLLPIADIDNLPFTNTSWISGYRENLKVANRLMQHMVDTILRQSGGQAIIMVMGDHGYRIDKSTKPGQSFPNFNALYFPDKDYRTVPDSLTNVNEFRIVLNKCCGTGYPLLPDKCCFLEPH